MLTALYRDIFKGWSRGEALYGWGLILFQIGFYVIYPDSPLGFITGVAGTICVLLVAKGRISNYLFGFVQVSVAIYLGWGYGLIGETGENIFYLVAQFVGIMAWKNHIDEETHDVQTESFTLGKWVIALSVIASSTLILGLLFDYLGGNQVWLDSSTLVLALVATGLQVLRYREQWLLWIVLNVISIYQFFLLGNMSLVAMYVVFLVNVFYGYYSWSKKLELED